MIKSTVVVSEKEEEIKILDPDTYKTVTLLKPEGFEGNKDEVNVIEAEGHLYILSE